MVLSVEISLFLRKRRGAMKSKLTKDLFRIPYALLVLIGIWYLAHLMVASPIIPSPLQGILRFFHLFPELVRHMGASFLRIVLALCITLLIGYPLAVLLGRNSLADSLGTPLVYGVYPIPKIAFLPLLMVLFGITNQTKVILVFLIVISQIIISVRASIRAVPYRYIRSVRMLGATPWELFKHVLFPASLPQLLTAIKLGVGTGLSVLFFAESFGTTWGIGWYIMDSWVRISYKDMFAGIIGVSLLGMILFWVITLVERRLVPWSKRSLY